MTHLQNPDLFRKNISNGKNIFWHNILNCKFLLTEKWSCESLGNSNISMYKKTGKRFCEPYINSIYIQYYTTLLVQFWVRTFSFSSSCVVCPILIVAAWTYAGKVSATEMGTRKAKPEWPRWKYEEHTKQKL